MAPERDSRRGFFICCPCSLATEIETTLRPSQLAWPSDEQLPAASQTYTASGSGMDKINDAIRDCWERCQLSADPLGEVLRYLRDLRRNPDWTEEEILQVRNGLLTLLTEK